MRETQTTPVRRLTLFVCLVLVVVFVLVLVIYHQAHARGPGRKEPLKGSETTLEQRGINYFAGKYCYGGEPRPTPAFQDGILVLTNAGFVVGYNEQRNNPAWVCYRLFKVDNLTAPPRPKNFGVDRRTTSTVSESDYTGSGYDRGHMAPNYAIAVCYDPASQLQTFLMSNIAPQKPKLNRGVWKNMETLEIREYAQKFNVIWIMTGPVFTGQEKRIKSGVAIPDKFYKIITREEHGSPMTMAFIVPQTVEGGESPQQFLASIRDIEKDTGLDFFSELPAAVQDGFETKAARSMW